ncbi:hypothetical protein PTKIN_Ptkin05aG0179700 [Pterospermum kingtungense]
MKPGHVSGTETNPSQNNHVSPDKSRLSPSRSSSSSSTSDEFIQLSSTRNSTTSDTGLFISEDKHNSSMPPTQAMESGGFPLSTSDRIPSHVFATTSTTTPTEWSVASNDSLFSIQMGTMSFTKDQFGWMTKSGELSYNYDTNMASPCVETPSNQTPTRKSSEKIAKKSGNLNETEVAAAETMREVLREKESQHKDTIAKDPRSLSQHSDASIKSFAFPILTGDADKSGTKHKKKPSQPSTPKTAPETPKTSPETPKPQTCPEIPKPESSPKSQATPKANAGGQRKWFSCLFCCPSRP